MSREEQLAWEERAGKPAAIAAIATALVGFGGYVLYQSSISDREDGMDGLLAAIDDHSSDYLAAGVLQAISLLLLIPVLLYLYRLVRARRPEFSQSAAVLGVVGALGFAITAVVQQQQLIDAAQDFFPFEGKGDVEDAAEDHVEDALSPALQGVGVGGQLALAVSIVMLGVNAIRVGLLSRFMGVLGVAMGVMMVIPFGIQPVLQLFWLTALAAMFLGRWPGGRGPAWQTGEAVPWPSAAEQRDEIARRRAEREGPPEEPAEDAAPKPRSRKRKRKR